MRVALAEDSGLFRQGLRVLLEEQGIEVTAQTSTGERLLAAVNADPPDVAILDIRMPPTFTDEGMATATRIRERHPGVAVLVLSTYAETPYAIRLLQAARVVSGTCSRTMSQTRPPCRRAAPGVLRRNRR